MLDILIIGTGPVGLYAATLAKLHNLKGEVIESLDIIGGQLTNLYPEKDIIDLPGFLNIKANEFIDVLYKQASLGDNALKISTNEKMLSYEKKDSYYLIKTNTRLIETKTLLICSGMGMFSPRKLANTDHLKNVLYSIKNINELNNKIVILGGGDSACDWAVTLKQHGYDVALVHRRDDFRAKSQTVDLMTSLGVKIYKPFNVDKIIEENDIAKAIVIKNEQEEITLDLSYLFVNYGLITTSNMYDLETINNSIKVDTCMRTSQENIFAIGNACSYLGKVKNITNGFGEAVIAITKIDQIINPTKNIPIHF